VARIDPFQIHRRKLIDLTCDLTFSGTGANPAREAQLKLFELRMGAFVHISRNGIPNAVLRDARARVDVRMRHGQQCPHSRTRIP
jgi:hypothetical protein